MNRKFKLGDRVWCNSDRFGTIVAFDTIGDGIGKLHAVYRVKIDREDETIGHLEKYIILESVYNSPVYKLLNSVKLTPSDSDSET